MIDKVTKKNLIESFDTVVVATSNFKSLVAKTGEKRFRSGNVKDIYEMAKIMTQISELEHKLGKTAALMQEYRLDLAEPQLLEAQSTEIQIKDIIKRREST